MREYDFWLDGEPASAHSIKMQGAVSISAPVPVVDVVNVPGRNGSIIYEYGSYSNRLADISCFALQDDAAIGIRGANEYLLSKHGYRRIEFADDPDHFYIGRVSNGAEIAQRLGILAPFNVAFDCKPQRWLKDGERPLQIATSGQSIFNPTGFAAAPVIELHGSGEARLYVNDCECRILELVDGMRLDSETQNASKDAQNLNAKVYIPEFPMLESGINNISWTGGIESVTIVPRWWTL